MPSIFDRVYQKSPLWLKKIGIDGYGYILQRRRFGGNFRKYVSEYIGREGYTTEAWREYQTQQMQKLLLHAAKHVPYYQQAFGHASVRDFEDFGLEQLAELPLLEKQVIRSDPDALVASTVSQQKLHEFHTSGTTGTPLVIKGTNDTIRRWSAAYETRVRRWAGVNNKMSRAMIGGRLVVPMAEAEPPFWQYNWIEHQLYMSAFHISPENARHYAAALNHYKPEYLVGYASSHFFLARMINRQALDVIHLKAVLTSSEKLTPEMRSEIETAYSCSVFDAYSGVEACCLASECEYHNLHVSPDVGIIEILDQNGHPAKPGELGEIVATGFLNFEQPLIRYRTGDLAVWSDKICPCGRNMPILEELVGRLEDTIIGPGGRELVRFHGIFVGLPHIREGQVIQESLLRFRLKLVVEPEFDEDDRKIIFKRFYDRLGSVELELELVDFIERTERGKFRAVISNV